MILEERDYRIVAGRMGDFLSTYERLGLPVQKEVLGGFIGHFTTDIGELNRVVAFWRYDSMADRESRRQLMQAHPGWPPYLASINGMVDTQSTRILKPTHLSPLR